MDSLNLDELAELARTADPETLDILRRYLDVQASPYHRFQPRPDRPELLDQQSAFVHDDFPGLACLIGGTGSGKSYAAAYKVARFLRSTPPPREQTPFWVLSQTMDMASGNGWGKNLSTFLAEQVSDVVWYSQARKLPAAVVLVPHANGNQWVLEFRSYDSDRRRLQAFSIGGFWCDELCPYSLLIEVWGRCRDYDFPGSKLYTLTPIVDGSKGYSTLELEEIYKDQDQHPDWRFYRLNSELNTALAPGFVERYIVNEIEELRETRLTGAFCTMTGAIYKNFGDAHLCEPFSIPDEWTQLRAIDFGWSHETVCLWLARTPTGHYYVHNEYARQETTLDRHAEAIKAVPFPGGRTYADPAAAQERAEFDRLGIPTDRARNDVLPGIAAIQRLLREKRLHVFNTCPKLIKQLRSYCWSKTVRDKPDKQADDLVDALRYGCYSDLYHYNPPPAPPTKSEALAIKARRQAEFLSGGL